MFFQQIVNAWFEDDSNQYLIKYFPYWNISAGVVLSFFSKKIEEEEEEKDVRIRNWRYVFKDIFYRMVNIQRGDSMTKRRLRRRKQIISSKLISRAFYEIVVALIFFALRMILANRRLEILYHLILDSILFSLVTSIFSLFP